MTGASSREIYRFRDYWSNRNGYGKTRAENDALDKISTKISLPMPDFVLVEKKNQLCSLVNREQKAVYENLKNPYTVAQDLKVTKIEEELGLFLIRACRKVLFGISIVCITFAVIFYFFRSPVWFITTTSLAGLGILSGLIAFYTLYAKSLVRFWFLFLFTLGIFLLFFSLLPGLLESILAFARMMLGGPFVFAMGVFMVVYIVLFLFQLNVETPLNIAFSKFLPLLLGFFAANLAYLIAFLNVIPTDISFTLLPYRIAPFLFIATSILYVPSFRAYSSWFIVYLYDGRSDSENFPFTNNRDCPGWLVASHKIYWVIRHILFWRFEIAFPFPHPDFERIELWVDAFSGDLEWIVTDYHYRELWIRPDERLSKILVDWDGNFHTPVVYPHELVVDFWRKITQSPISLENILSFTNQFQVLTSSVRKAYQEARNLNAIRSFFDDIGRAGAFSCNTLPWMRWRYPFGAYPENKSFERWKRYADIEIGGLGDVSSEPQVSFDDSVLKQYHLDHEHPRVKF